MMQYPWPPQGPTGYPPQSYQSQVPPQHHPYPPGNYPPQPALQNQPQVIKGTDKSSNTVKIAVGVAAGTVGVYVLGKALGASLDIIGHSSNSSSSSSSSSDSDSD